MADTVYKVKDPSGAIREIRGPEGATDEEVIAQAQKLFAAPAPSASPSPPEPSSPKALLRLGASLETSGRIPLSERARFPDIPDLINKTAEGVGGAVTDIAAKYLSPEAAAAAGVAANVGVQAVPVMLGGEPAKAASSAIRSGSERLMQSALKPSITSLKTGQAAQAISTMLDEGITVSKGGVAKLKAMISALNDDVVRAIVASPATVDKNKVANALLVPLRKFERQVNPTADMRAIEGAWTEFINHPLLSGKQNIPVQLAQEIKQGTYKTLGDKAYSRLGIGAADEAAQKALAGGLREEIATAVPEVAQLNAKEAKLLNALQNAEHRALSEGNKNLSGLAWLSNNPAAWGAFMADRSAAFKSIVARMLNAGKEQIPATAARAGIYTAINQPQSE